MASLIDIRRRLRSVRNIQQITRAMKMVAAAKLRRSQDRVIAARPYAASLRDVLANVSARVREARHPLLAERDEKKVLLMVVAGDKGLAGAFNANVNRAVGALLREKSWEEVTLLPVGKKAFDFWKRRSIPIRASYPGIFSRLEFRHAREIAEILTGLFVSGEIDSAYVVYNEFKSIMTQVVRVERLLPIARTAMSTAEQAVDYLFEPDPAEILARLLPRYLEFAVFKVLLESAASENGARMTAMDSSTKNAGDMIDSLTLTYNRARQARITKELIEIVSGAAALD
ncbi:MAG TPA: ATP synthase F1 subunit gamma [Thermoanaerobaculia bacterium]|jgi:F-type H+-transporting ATPase subunit gamma|nr:ATP synthase F1 subunit gamma [Thermoanaerobaculia bacterium]